MLVIGFADKFYTLWDVESHQESDHYGNNYTVTRYAYIRNISIDKDKVIERYPGISIDESLRGHHSFERRTNYAKPAADPTKFNFGKYRDMTFKECVDGNYMNWYRRQVDEATEINIKNRLIELGWICLENGDMLSSEDYASAAQEIADFKDMKAKLEAGEPIVITMEYAPRIEQDENYNYIDVLYNTPICCCIFGEGLFTVGKYQGMEYGMLALNGKGKRTKNKQIKIIPSSYEFYPSTATHPGGFADITVQSFEILK